MAAIIYFIWAKKNEKLLIKYFGFYQLKLKLKSCNLQVCSFNNYLFLSLSSSDKKQKNLSMWEVYGYG